MVIWLFGDSRVKRENEKPVDVISGSLVVVISLVLYLGQQESLGMDDFE